MRISISPESSPHGNYSPVVRGGFYPLVFATSCGNSDSSGRCQGFGLGSRLPVHWPTALGLAGFRQCRPPADRNVHVMRDRSSANAGRPISWDLDFSATSHPLDFLVIIDADVALGAAREDHRPLCNRGSYRRSLLSSPCCCRRPARRFPLSWPRTKSAPCRETSPYTASGPDGAWRSRAWR
jgi:hypothetical protein